MAEVERVDVAAGDYIEDDPAAWQAIVKRMLAQERRFEQRGDT